MSESTTEEGRSGAISENWILGLRLASEAERSDENKWPWYEFRKLFAVLDASEARAEAAERETEELIRQRDSANRAATWYFERMRDNNDWCNRFVNGLQRIGDATPQGARNIARSLLDDWHAGNTFAEDATLTSTIKPLAAPVEED